MTRFTRLRTLSMLSLALFGVTAVHSVLIGVPALDAHAEQPAECSDAVDNDNDGDVDYPEDQSCLSPIDNSEGGPTQSQVPHPFRPACDDGVDNDNDRQTDYPEDGGCENARDDNEGPGIYRDGNPEEYREYFNEPPLHITVSDGREFAEPNEVLEYRITVDNSAGPNRVVTVRAQLPTELELGQVSGGARIENRSIEWVDQVIPAGERLSYVLSARISAQTPDLQALRLKVYAGRAIGTDTTSIYRGVLPAAFGISVTDRAQSARAGDILEYDITVTNQETKLATDVDVNASIPLYTEFVAASEGGTWTGKNVRWAGLTVSPKGERFLQVRLRVRSDAPIGATLQFVAEVKGHQAADLTEVGQRSDVSERGDARPVLLRKTADRDEVRPGERITYTVYLRNTTNQDLTNLFVEDRLDERFMAVVGGETGRKVGDRIVWDIPVLRPGEDWQVRYTVLVNPQTPHGETLLNVVTVTGDGLEKISLTERVQAGRIGVVRKLPPTGAGMDALFLLVSGVLSLVPVAVRRRMA